MIPSKLIMTCSVVLALSWMEFVSPSTGAYALPRQSSVVSVCDVHSLTEGSAEKKITIEGTLFKIADGNGLYLVDDRCSGVMVPVRHEIPMSADSDIDKLNYLVYGAGQSSWVGKRAYCLCRGTIKRSPSSDVLYVEKVEKVWVSSEAVAPRTRSH